MPSTLTYTLILSKVAIWPLTFNKHFKTTHELDICYNIGWKVDVAEYHSFVLVLGKYSSHCQAILGHLHVDFMYNEFLL